MIVIVIIGVLALIAIPKFMGVTARANRVEAKTLLKQVTTLQQAHLYERDVYGSSLPAIGFEASEVVTGGGTARTIIAMEKAGAHLKTEPPSPPITTRPSASSPSVRSASSAPRQA